VYDTYLWRRCVLDLLSRCTSVLILLLHRLLICESALRCILRRHVLRLLSRSVPHLRLTQKQYREQEDAIQGRRHVANFGTRK